MDRPPFFAYFNPETPLRTLFPRLSLWRGVLALCSVGTALASVPAPYTVATWHGFRKAAISYTFDDNTPGQFSTALPLFNEKGFRMTLYPVVEWNGDNWQRLIDAAAAGHEIGSHTLTHPRLNTLTIEEQATEVEGSKQTIDAHIPGQQCVTLAYPYCVSPARELTEGAYIAARTCSQEIVSATPSDYYQISSIVCGDKGTVQTKRNFEQTHQNALSRGGWAVYLIHGIDDDGGYSPLSSTILGQSLDYLKERPELYWVDTFANVIRYIQEREAVSLSERAEGSDLLFLTITDGLDDAIFQHPLTFRRPLPDGWTGARVHQGLHFSEAETVEIEGVTYLVFDAIPDAGEVLLVNKAKTPLPPELSLTSQNGSGGGTGITLHLAGGIGDRYTISGSTNLTDWEPLEAPPLDGPVGEVTVAPSDASYFYRAEPVADETTEN